MPLNLDQIGQAQIVVKAGIATSLSKAEDANNALTKEIAALTGMLNSISQIPPIAGTLPPLKTTVDPFIAPSDPVITSISPNFPILAFYSSQLLSDVKTVLDGLVINLRQTGLQPWILQQEWDREREKTLSATQGVIDNIGRQYSASGWIMPTGDEIEAIFRALEQQAEQDAASSRNIATTNATLEQKNLQFSIGQAAQLEGILGNMSVAIQTMLVEEEKTRLLTLTEINKLNADVFKTEVDAQASKIGAQVASQNNEINYDSKQADLSIEVAKANVATMLSSKELSINTLSMLAKLLAQLVAGYSSSVNYGASISNSLGYSASDSTGISTSISYPHKPT